MSNIKIATSLVLLLVPPAKIPSLGQKLGVLAMILSLKFVSLNHGCSIVGGMTYQDNIGKQTKSQKGKVRRGEVAFLAQELKPSQNPQNSSPVL